MIGHFKDIQWPFRALVSADKMGTPHVGAAPGVDAPLVFDGFRGKRFLSDRVTRRLRFPADGFFDYRILIR